MAIDIDSFLNKLETKKESEIEKLNTDSEIEENEKVNLEFEKEVLENFETLSADIKNKDLLQLKEIYEDLKKFDESMPSKFLNIQNVGSSTLDTLNSQYSSKLLETLENNSKYYTNKIKENNIKIEDDLISREYKTSIKLIKENKELLSKFPKEFGNEKHQLILETKKYEIKIHQEIRNFKVKEAQHIKKELLNKIKNIKNTIQTNSIEEIEHSIRDLELLFNKIPSIFKPVFVDENILIQKAIINAETKILELENKQFSQKEKELKIVQDKFQNSLIKKDLNSALLLYNEILFLFEDLPNTNFKKKNTYLSTLSKLHGQLNNLYVKSNVELLLRSYSNSKIIEEARNYIDHIELTKRLSPENVNLIYSKLKKLPKSTHIEQDSMIKKYEILLDKCSEKKQEKSHIEEEENNEFESPLKAKIKEDELPNNENTPEENIEDDTIKEAKKYLKEIKNTHSVSKAKLNQHIKNLNNGFQTTQTIKIIDIFENILKKLEKKQEKPKIIKEISNKVKMDKNVAEEIEELYHEMKDVKTKKEKSIIYKKILFYLDLVNLPIDKKDSIKEKIKIIYERN